MAGQVTRSELSALAQRAGVEIDDEEWELVEPGFNKTQAALRRLLAVLRPGDAPAFTAREKQ